MCARHIIYSLMNLVMFSTSIIALLVSIKPTVSAGHTVWCHISLALQSVIFCFHVTDWFAFLTICDQNHQSPRCCHEKWWVLSGCGEGSRLVGWCVRVTEWRRGRVTAVCARVCEAARTPPPPPQKKKKKKKKTKKNNNNFTQQQTKTWKPDSKRNCDKIWLKSNMVFYWYWPVLAVLSPVTVLWPSFPPLVGCRVTRWSVLAAVSAGGRHWKKLTAGKLSDGQSVTDFMLNSNNMNQEDLQTGKLVTWISSQVSMVTSQRRRRAAVAVSP